MVDVEDTGPGRQLVCGCHGSRFDLDGRVLAGPAVRPLRRLAVAMVADRIFIEPVL